LCPVSVLRTALGVDFLESPVSLRVSAFYGTVRPRTESDLSLGFRGFRLDADRLRRPKLYSVPTVYPFMFCFFVFFCVPDFSSVYFIQSRFKLWSPGDQEVKACSSTLYGSSVVRTACVLLPELHGSMLWRTLRVAPSQEITRPV
jgi:hypothetical protein